MDFSEYEYSDLDKIFSNCENIDYLTGAGLANAYRSFKAIVEGDESIIDEWQLDYQNKLDQSIEFGILEKQIFYKFLLLQNKVLMEGFSAHESEIQDLRIEAQRNNDHYKEVYILLTLWEKVLDDSEKRDIIGRQIDDLFLNHPELKDDYVYIIWTISHTLAPLYEEEEEYAYTSDD